MFHLLLFLSVLVLQPHTLHTVEVDITDCPLTYFGLEQAFEIFVGATIDNLYICFNDEFTSSTSECIIVDQSGVTVPLNLEAVVLPAASLMAEFQAELPYIKLPADCGLMITVDDVTLQFGKFGTQSGVKVNTTSGTYVVDFLIENVSKDTGLVQSSSPFYSDTSGCRDGMGAFVGPSTTGPTDPDCMAFICSDLSEANIGTTCTENERCQGDNTCGFDQMCTVIGDTIIAFDDTTDTVPDRCIYVLVSSSDLVVKAFFRERLLKTQKFIDALEITEIGATLTIKILQDGRVEVDGAAETLTDTPTVYGSTGTLSKDDHGIKYNGFNLEIVFDGNSASITYLGIASDLSSTFTSGVCTDSTFVDNKDDGSDSTCADVQTDTDAAAHTIDCTSTTPSRCDLLDDAAFAPCHTVVDQAPYKEACASTLCNYPAVDGFNCQFMLNYVKKCEARDVILDLDFFSLGCAHRSPLCCEQPCLEEEYCGMMSNGRCVCLCRGDFSESYREDDTYGGELTCSADSATLVLHGCFLEQHSIDPTKTHLIDETCKGSYDTATKEVTLTFTSADTCMSTVEYTTNPNQLKYTNRITGSDADDAIITRTEDYTFSFSCCFDQPEKQMATFTIAVNELTGLLVGEFEYTMSTMVATDPGFSVLVTDSTEIALNNKVYVKISADTLDSALMVLVIDNCYAQDFDMTTSMAGDLRHDLITDGCAVDPTTVTSGFGEDTFNSFCFAMFQFLGKDTKVKLTCEVLLCAPGTPPDSESSCVPDCSSSGGRRRRSANNYLNQEPGLMSITWTN